MTDRQQIDAFDNDLRALVERYVQEFNISTAGAIGVLQMKVVELTRNALKQAEEDDE